MRLLGNVLLRGTIRCESGLHIGTEAPLEIGGVNNPVIKDPTTGKPYIPGSSLKGKMRSLMEWEKGMVKDSGDVHSCDPEDDEVDIRECPICRIFGVSAGEEVEIGPTRLTVRDAFPTKATEERLERLDTERLYTEVKEEVKINRVTSDSNPRNVERVPRDSTFGYTLVYSVYDLSPVEDEIKDLEHLKHVETALNLLEDSSLGGSGSRGSGQVSIEMDEEYEVRTMEYYRKHSESDADETAEIESETVESIEDIGEVLGIS